MVLVQHLICYCGCGNDRRLHKDGSRCPWRMSSNTAWPGCWMVARVILGIIVPLFLHRRELSAVSTFVVSLASSELGGSMAGCGRNERGIHGWSTCVALVRLTVLSDLLRGQLLTLLWSLRFLRNLPRLTLRMYGSRRFRSILVVAVDASPNGSGSSYRVTATDAPRRGRISPQLC